MATYASSLAREFHGQRSLVGYSPAIILTLISIYWIKEYIFAQNISVRNSFNIHVENVSLLAYLKVL